MIRTGYNKGPSWWCDKCDIYHNGYLFITMWTAGIAPQYCSRCDIESIAIDALLKLRKQYPDRFATPGSVRLIRKLLLQHKLIPSGVDPGRFAAIVNQTDLRLSR